MNIQIKEDASNSLGANEKRILARINNPPESYDMPPTWSFIEVSSPTNSTILHSNDTVEGTFLRYGEDETPTIFLNLSEEGTYEIKIVCKIGRIVPSETAIMTLNDDGELVETYEMIDKNEYDFYESSVLTLVYSQDNEWT